MSVMAQDPKALHLHLPPAPSRPTQFNMPTNWFTQDFDGSRFQGLHLILRKQ